jgi:hypothetical protein
MQYTRAIPKLMHTVNALPIQSAYAKRLNVALLGGIPEVNKAVFIVPVEPFKWVMKLLQVGLLYLIKDHS